MKPKKRPVSDLLRNFADRAAPESRPLPLDELTARFKEKRREQAGFMPLGNLTGTERLVDLRIREWMMRMQGEAKELKDAEELSKKRNIIPKK